MDDTVTPEVEGFGLMYYRARWLDPQLGRFVQADSIVPGGVQGLDRYAYVNNNPMRFTDPSGHRCQPEDECDTPRGDYMPTPLELSKLSKEKGWKTGKSATDLYNYYLSLFGQRDQFWWKAFKRFSVWDFISLITFNESGYDPDSANTFAEAGVRFFVEWAETRNSSTNVYGVLNWFARFSESAKRLIDGNSIPQPFIRTTDEISKMSIVGISFANIPQDWATGWAPDRPYNWGNASVLSVNAQQMYKNNPQAMFLTISDENNPFYIPSGCAWLNWQEHGNQAACP